MNEELNEEQMRKAGKRMAHALGLPIKENGRYDMEGGDKTALGVWRTIVGWIETAERTEGKAIW